MENTQNVVLKTYGLVKNYKDHTVLNDVNMTIYEGDIYGFVGENGAGKTTIIRAITGLIHCQSGYYELFGKKSTEPDFDLTLKKIGGIVEKPSFFGNLSAIDNIVYQQEMIGLEKNIQNAYDLLRLVDLDNVDEKKKVKDYSLGMKQRLAIAMCMVNNPDFLLLDEPMNGLDPKGIADLRNLIIDLNQNKGVTFLISSHILSELDLVATRYGIISKGKMVKEIDRNELNNSISKYIELVTSNNMNAFNLIHINYPDLKVEYQEQCIRIYNIEDYNHVLQSLLENGITIQGITSKQEGFENYYLKLMKEAK